MPNIGETSAEAQLIGILLTSGSRQEILKECYPILFEDEDLRKFFIEGKKEGFVCTPEMISERLGKPDRDKDIILYCIHEAMRQNEWSKPDPSALIRYLKERTFRKQILHRAVQLKLSAERYPLPQLQTDIDSTIQKIKLLETTLMRKPPKSAVQIARNTADRINSNRDVIKTGFDFIDKRTGGLTREAISSLLAKPKHMKSSFCDALVSGMVEKFGVTGVIISLEDPAEERVKRIIAPRLGLSLSGMRFKQVVVNPEDIVSLFEKNFRSKLYIYDKKDVLTPEDAASIILDIRPDIVVIDHIQKFMLDDMVQGMIRAINVVENAVIKVGGHALITSQVADKKIQQRESSGAPSASDAQWTSALYQSSAEMFSLYYHYQTTKNPFEDSMLEFHILACRFAQAVGKYRIEINPDRAEFIREMT